MNSPFLSFLMPSPPELPTHQGRRTDVDTHEHKLRWLKLLPFQNQSSTPQINLYRIHRLIYNIPKKAKANLKKSKTPPPPQMCSLPCVSTAVLGQPDNLTSKHPSHRMLFHTGIFGTYNVYLRYSDRHKKWTFSLKSKKLPVQVEC